MLHFLQLFTDYYSSHDLVTQRVTVMTYIFLCSSTAMIISYIGPCVTYILLSICLATGTSSVFESETKNWYYERKSTTIGHTTNYRSSNYLQFLEIWNRNFLDYRRRFCSENRKKSTNSGLFIHLYNYFFSPWNSVQWSWSSNEKLKHSFSGWAPSIDSCTGELIRNTEISRHIREILQDQVETVNDMVIRVMNSESKVVEQVKLLIKLFSLPGGSSPWSRYSSTDF